MSRRRQPNTDGGRPGRHNVKTTPAQEAEILLAAGQHGVTPARYLVEAALAVARAERAGVGPETATSRRSRVQELFALRHALAEMALQARRVGVNVNQLARKANVGGGFPVGEARTYLAEEQRFLDESFSIAERIDALIEALRGQGIDA